MNENVCGLLLVHEEKIKKKLKSSKTKQSKKTNTKAVKKNAFSHLYPTLQSYGTWPPSTFQGRASCAAKEQLFWIIKIINTSKSNTTWGFSKH